MSFSTSQLQQIRALVTSRINDYRIDRDVCLENADKAEEDLKAGKFAPECTGLVETARTAMWNTATKLTEKIAKLDALLPVVGAELKASIFHPDTVVFDFETVGDFRNLFADPFLVFSTAILADRLENDD